MKSISSIVVWIIIVAIVAVVVNRQAQTSNIIQAFGQMFSKIVSTAVGPVQGS